jgi:lipopolysaccharide/colanic/teichoic acid biosynthesis glycosyltransferase
LSSITSSFYRNFIKRALDIVLVGLAAAVVLPIIAVFALIIFLTDGHAPFYCQERVGRNRRVFRMWKLRSMVIDADAALEAHLASDPAARAEWDRHQKLRKDPRITWIGRVIRKVSLDELPQLWNVVRGDMSLVGPRPIMTSQVHLYPGTAYYRLRPGLTGFWQVSSRNKSTFAERARFDRLYEMRLSFTTDLAVILRTVSVVLRGTGV